MCTYAEEAWHQEAYSEKEGGKFAEAGPPPVGSGGDTGVAGQVSQAHHPLRAARRHPRGLCAVGLFLNLLQPSLVRVLKGSLSLGQGHKYGLIHLSFLPYIQEFREAAGSGFEPGPTHPESDRPTRGCQICFFKGRSEGK